MHPMTIRNKNGFSLVEVMVSMFILAIGVIGASGMQLAALRTTHQSALQTRALQLAADMADVIRTNVTGHNSKPFPKIDYRASNESEPEAPAQLCYANPCDAEEFVDFEIYEWKQRIKSALPDGRVQICYDSRPWDNAEKALTWECHAGPGNDAPLVIKLGWQRKNPDGSLVKESDNGFPPSVALAVTP